jgi:hypothetical protein
MNVVMKFVMPSVMKYCSDASLILVSERIPADDEGAPDSSSSRMSLSISAPEKPVEN